MIKTSKISKFHRNKILLHIKVIRRVEWSVSMLYEVSNKFETKLLKSKQLNYILHFTKNRGISRNSCDIPENCVILLKLVRHSPAGNMARMRSTTAEREMSTSPSIKAPWGKVRRMRVENEKKKRKRSKNGILKKSEKVKKWKKEK
jgi:altronate dehydratase